MEPLNEHYITQEEEIHRQVAIADMMLLNKAGGVDEESLSGYHQSGQGSHLLARDPRQGHSIFSYSFHFPGDFDIERFPYWIEYFLYIDQANVFRIKGILSFAGNPQKMILQTVRSSYQFEDWEFWNAGEGDTQCRHPGSTGKSHALSMVK